ncbi:TetR family transcriptional regulator [Altericroceibacterium endophyticum]|uniref:TetR family transcriptional regulator n=1 Tax=Altericroceibacterium endophyticum TaxID=1808508 RepID=A0A6I4T7X6_9SPHN|nr:TetR family transcriptional regulator [Altericroceibacterium endophyticum]MXO67066.1 TetR family transcriptional regulator [Altericroceibacterium endophyticum]
MRPSKDDPLLDHDRIVSAAWELVEQDGLAGLSSRKLAAKLGVKGPAIYYHVPSMQDLYGMMIERLLEMALERTPQTDDWREWIRNLAHNHCTILLEFPDSGRIASLSRPTDTMRKDVVPQFSEVLMRAGLPRNKALAATGALGSFILGYVINLQHEGHLEFASSIHPVSETFDFAVDAFVEALARDMVVGGGR